MMDNEAMEAESGETSGVRPLDRRKELLEILVFLFLIVPSMAFSFFAVRQGALSFNLTAAATILRDSALSALVLFFIWSNGEGSRRLGWTGSRLLREIAIGVVLFIPFALGASALESILREIGLTAPSTPLPSLLPDRNVGELLLSVLLVAVVAVAEETIFRGYLILRFQSITNSPTSAVFLSAGIFALGHGYEGSAGVVTVGVMGLVFALVYLWRGSLVAPMVMHFLQDFLGIVLLPLVL